jgi:hypothetical protein
MKKGSISVAVQTPIKWIIWIALLIIVMAALSRLVGRAFA